MRRLALRALALVAAAALLVAGYNVATQPVTPGPPPAQRVVDGFKWMVSSPGASPDVTFTQSNTCDDPAVQAACQQMLDAVQAMVVAIMLDKVKDFVTN